MTLIFIRKGCSYGVAIGLGVGDCSGVLLAGSAPSTFMEIPVTELPKLRYGGPEGGPGIDALTRGEVVSHEYFWLGKNFPTLIKYVELAGTAISPV